MDIENIIEFWNDNFYSQLICVQRLLEFVESVNVSDEVSRLKEDTIYVLHSILNKFIVRNKIKINNTILFFENVIADNTILSEIACILSGEYLSSNLDNLISILEYWKWNIPVDKNMFIVWYYNLIGCYNFYDYVTKVYKERHNIALLKIIAIVVLGSILFMSVESILEFLSYTYLSSIPGIIVFGVQYLLLMFLLLLFRLILVHFELNILVRNKPRFYNYNIRRKL